MKYCEECLKELDKKDMPYKCFNRGYAKSQIDLKLNEEKIRADERAKVIEDVHKAMAYKYHCKEDLCEVGMTCADCLKEYMKDLYSNKYNLKEQKK